MYKDHTTAMLERIATALEALVEQGKPAFAIADLTDHQTALERLVRDLAIVTASEEPLDGGIWVLDAAAAKELPVGTSLGLDGSTLDEEWGVIAAPGLLRKTRWSDGDHVALGHRNFFMGRKVLNPEVLGEFHEPTTAGPDVYLVYDRETLLGLPVGTRYSYGTSFEDEPFERESCASPLKHDQNPDSILTEGFPRMILNPEILGEFRPVEVVPTYLEGQAAYDAAPVGTRVIRVAGVGSFLEKGPEGWTASDRSVWGLMTQLSNRRRVLRWGPAPVLVSVADYENAPVGTVLKPNADYPGEITKESDGLWHFSQGGTYGSCFMGGNGAEPRTVISTP